MVGLAEDDGKLSGTRAGIGNGRHLALRLQMVESSTVGQNWWRINKAPSISDRSVCRAYVMYPT